MLLSTHCALLTTGETTSHASPLLNYAITQSTQESRHCVSAPVWTEGEQRANTCTGLFSKSSLLRRVMAKENTFLPLHTGEASAETLQSLVNNTTNQDRDPYLS